MPLLDHFHPPLLGTRHWESFHALWAGVLVGASSTSICSPKGISRKSRFTSGVGSKSIWERSNKRSLSQKDDIANRRKARPPWQP